MSKCKKCDNELKGVETTAWFDGLCEKCWQEKHYIEYPFKKGIKEKDDEIAELNQQLAEKDKEINKLKKPKKYVYNCLSFVSNSDATDVAKYIEDLHQTIAQNNEDLDEYIKKIVKLKEIMEDKDKEINKLSEEHFELFGNMKNYKNLWLAEQRKNKEIRHQICEKIRENGLTDQVDEIKGVFISYKTLDQIEKGENK